MLRATRPNREVSIDYVPCLEREVQWLQEFRQNSTQCGLEGILDSSKELCGVISVNTVSR